MNSGRHAATTRRGRRELRQTCAPPGTPYRCAASFPCARAANTATGLQPHTARKPYGSPDAVCLTRADIRRQPGCWKQRGQQHILKTFTRSCAQPRHADRPFRGHFPISPNSQPGYGHGKPRPRRHGTQANRDRKARVTMAIAEIGAPAKPHGSEARFSRHQDEVGVAKGNTATSEKHAQDSSKALAEASLLRGQQVPPG